MNSKNSNVVALPHSNGRQYSTEQFQYKLKQIHRYLQLEGYSIRQLNGQRILTRNTTEETVSTRGTEIFVGRLPTNILELDLVNLFSRVGYINELRLLINFCGYSRGFAFIKYATEKQADMAVCFFNGYRIKAHYRIGVFKSVDNRRLFIGSVPQDKNEEQLKTALEGCVNGLKEIIMYPPNEFNENGYVNRGYAFVEFEDHRSAAIARRILNGGVTLWSEKNPISCDWADPIPQVHPAIMSQVKKLYIRNIPLELTVGQLWASLSAYLEIRQIVQLHKIKDYAFVHFESRADAEEALHCLNNIRIKIGDKQLEVMWARPQIYSKEVRLQQPPENFCRSVPPKMRKRLDMFKSRSARSTGSSSTSS